MASPGIEPGALLGRGRNRCSAKPFWPLLVEFKKPTTPESVNKRRASHGQESNLQTAQTTRSLKPLTKADHAQWISNQSQKLEAG
jgi:hypothetical protein